MSCSDLSTNIEIKTATNNILNNINYYTQSSIYKPLPGGDIFNGDFKTKYETANINTNLNNIDENDGKENLATIEDDNVYVNCVYQSSIPWYTTSEDKKKCEVVPDIKLPENRLSLDKKTLTITPIFKSSNKNKPGFCSHFENVNKAYCENRWYDWIITPNYYLGNTYYKDNSHYTENDVYKCYAPCENDFMPFTATNGELKCIPKKYFNNGIFSNKYIFSSFGLINLIGNIALDDDDKQSESTNLLYILHYLIIQYNLENNYDKDMYSENELIKQQLLNFNINKNKYTNLYTDFKNCIDNNIFSKFSVSDNQDYSNTNEFTYKHRKFNEDETDMYSFNGLDVCNVLIDPILIHTWMLANLFKPLDETIIKSDDINGKINISDNATPESIENNKKNAMMSLLYEKLYKVFQDRDKAIRLKNIFFKAVNICYNGKTNFSINIIEKTNNAFSNDTIIDIIIDKKFYNFYKNLFFYNYLLLGNTVTGGIKPTTYPFNSVLNNTTTENNTTYKNGIKYILDSKRFEDFKDYTLYKDVEIEAISNTLTTESNKKDAALNKYNDLYFNQTGNDETIWKFKYFYSMERLERPTCESGYEWNSKYKVCDLKKKKEEESTETQKKEDDFEIPELANIMILFVKMILFIIVLYIIYIFYDIFSEVIISFMNAIILGVSYMSMNFQNAIVTGTTDYDKEVKKLENEKKYIEGKYKNIVNKDLQIKNYMESNTPNPL